LNGGWLTAERPRDDDAVRLLSVDVRLGNSALSCVASPHFVTREPLPPGAPLCYFARVNLEIRPATPAELDDVLSVLDEAAAWLNSIGVTQQWPTSFSRDASERALVETQLRLGQFHLAYLDGLAVGVFRLITKDPQAWPEPDAEEALYLHSFAVRRAVAGSDVALNMLAWARGHAAKDGRSELRLDCWAGNARLRRYYASAGFAFRGERSVAMSNGGYFEIARFAIDAKSA
jgi:RimJ/RimL family protein N-acetyltransferase